MSSQVPSAFQAALARGLISRRTAIVGMAGVTGVAALAACGSAGTGSSGGATSQNLVKAATDLSATEKVVNWSNWPSYMDVDEKTKKHPTLDAFNKETGIKVNYTEDYNDNSEFYAKVRPLLAAGKDTGRDLWVSTDWMAARFVRQNYVQKLDLGNIPNHDNVEDALLNVPWDKGRLYSLPWQSGMTGIAWNPKSTGGKKVESMDQLLTDPALKGKVTLLTEMPDTIGLVLIAMGKDPAAFTDADFDAAIAELQKAKDAGQIKGFTGNDYTKPLASGDTAACMAWSGDIVQLKADNPTLGFALPQKGFMIWSDNLLIPNLAKHKKNAETLINYYYDPKVMAEVVDYVNYVSPVKGTKALLLESDPAVASNELILPTPETLARSHIFRGLNAAEETRYNRKFEQVVTG
ncbi:MAG: spermidine/putrescine ABC transporter substrate-binding protein [Actinomycetota bacterium]